MGVDCTFHHCELFCNKEGVFYSKAVLNLERRRELWNAIAPFETIPVKELIGYGGDSYGHHKTNPYGEPHKAAKAGDLVSLANHPSVLDDERNRAVWAYLSALNPETIIVIYWH